MKSPEFFILLAMIVAAPHLNTDFAIRTSIGYVVLAVLFKLAGK
jgi:hypothetical protein